MNRNEHDAYAALAKQAEATYRRATYHIVPAPSQHWIMRALRSCWRWL